MMMKKLSRRHLLSALCATAGVTAMPSLLGRRAAHSAPTGNPDRKFLIVIGAFGGASIIDSFLPFTHSEATDSDVVNCFPDANVKQPLGSNIRAVDWSANLFGTNITGDLSTFVKSHHKDMLVSTLTGTSVNHAVAQKRSITGNGAWNGRTLQEAIAHAYGADCPIANVNMGSLGYAAHGDDTALPQWAYMEPVAVPTLWPLALDGSRGLKVSDGSELQDVPNGKLLEAARELRNQRLDPESSFYKTFQLSEKLQRWKEQRNILQPKLEAANLIAKLQLLSDPDYPLSEYGLLPDDAADVAELNTVKAAFPNLLFDPLEAQAALAYLLIKHGVSVSVTIGPNFNITLKDDGQGGTEILNPPLSFDNSHQSHRATQSWMWNRMAGIIDNLIRLLKQSEFDSDTGESYWDRSLIYCATEFGRTKNRIGGSNSFGTGHHLNNGMLAVSPMLKGNTVLGGVNTTTGETYGYDPDTGAPNTNIEAAEADSYAGIVHAMGIDTGGALPEMKAFYG
jgi:hypothetical protein